MSDELENLSETEKPQKSVPRVQRISNPRPKKAAKKVVADSATAESFAESATIPQHPRDAADSGDSDWADSEHESVAEAEGGSAAENPKRKRRRRKGKGQSAPNPALPVHEEVHSLVQTDSNSARPISEPFPQLAPAPQHSVQPQLQRPKIDPALLTKMAWKIYLAEVSEEGVALIGDNDAKDLSRRCFRLAEIFIEEQSRRR